MLIVMILNSQEFLRPIREHQLIHLDPLWDLLKQKSEICWVCRGFSVL